MAQNLHTVLLQVDHVNIFVADCQHAVHKKSHKIKNHFYVDIVRLATRKYMLDVLIKTQIPQVVILLNGAANLARY